MNYYEVFALAVALGTDAFSVAMVIGIQQFDLMTITRISSITGIFHIIMPLLGLYGGHLFQILIASLFNINGKLDYIFNLVGAGLLMLIGLYMVLEKYLGREDELGNFELKGWGIIILATSVSIDALSIGVSLGMLDFSLSVVFIFGLVAGVMMWAGLYLGTKLGPWLGDHAQLLGGLALIYLGLHFAGLV